MYTSIITLLLFAVMALTSPLVNERRDPAIVWVTITTSVTATPSTWTLEEVETHHRHRHALNRAGSPLPANYAVGSELPSVHTTPKLATFENLAKSKAAMFQVHTITLSNPPTIQVGSSYVIVPSVFPVPQPSTSESLKASISSFLPGASPSFQDLAVDSFQIETQAPAAIPTDIPDFKTHPHTVNPLVPLVDSSATSTTMIATLSTETQSSQIEASVSMVMPTDIPDFKTHPHTANPLVPLAESSFTLASTIATESANIETSTISTPIQMTVVPSSSETTPSTSDLRFQAPAFETAIPTTFVPDLDPTSSIYKDLVLQHHNIHRRNHSADDLTWDDRMAGYAETIAKTCIWGHSLAPGNGGYGQNIAAGAPAGNISAALTNMFYNAELPLYPEFGTDLPDMTNFEAWGHFSQMVWKGSKSVGCYTAICSPPGANALKCKPDGSSFLKKVKCGKGGTAAIFTVCNYFPQGNMYGQYKNVGAPLSDRNVYVDMTGVHGL